MNEEKDFSIVKWFIFPALVLLFGAGIVYACIKVFGAGGSIPTILCLIGCLIISLILILHTGNKKNARARTAAFIFECAGILALVITCLCGVIVVRQFSGASQTIEAENKLQLAKGKETTEQIKALANLKSSRAQTTIAKSITTQPTPQEGEQKEKKLTLQDVYENAESLLVYPTIAEMLLYVIGLLVVFGMTIDFKSKDDVTPPLPPQRHTARSTFLAANAPLRASTAHTVDNGNGFYLSLSAQGMGVSIRFRERGSVAKHVIRVSDAEAETNHLYNKSYDELARWSLEKMKAGGKDSRPIYKKLEETL